MEGDTNIRDVKRAVRGSVDAYGRLIEKNKDYLYRTAFLYSGDEEAALEIVQETVLKGFRSIKQLRNPELFRTWITRILINTSKDYYRHEIRYAQMPEEEAAYEEAGITAEERADLYEAIRRLPEKYRTAVILRYFDGLKLATRVNRNPTAVAEAYFTGCCHGNLPDLLEPAHAEAFYPEILENSLLPADFGEHTLHCSHDCRNCSYCRTALEGALVNLNDWNHQHEKRR